MFHAWVYLFFQFAYKDIAFLLLTDGNLENFRATIMNLFFRFKAETYSPNVIVSPGVDGNTQKISFICDEHPHPPETKGTVRYEELIMFWPNKHFIMQQTSFPA